MSAWEWCVACGASRVDAPEQCHDGKAHRLARYTFREVGEGQGDVEIVAKAVAVPADDADGSIDWVEEGLPAALVDPTPVEPMMPAIDPAEKTFDQPVPPPVAPQASGVQPVAGLAPHLKGPSGIPFDPAFLARYRPLGVLGKGGAGVVYHVVETNSGREAALKFLVHLEKSALARFDAECQTLARLNHPRILKVFGQGHWKSFPFMLMEVVEGESLKDRLVAEGSLTVRSALEITIQVLEGLTYLHQQGVVHRDLKPANIFLYEGGDLKIGDFGVARSPWRQSALTEPGTVVGTPRYMAPEQATGDPITFATDLYSLGIVLFELLTGQPPFVAPSLAALLAAHVRKKPPVLQSRRPDLPAELEPVVARALEKRPARRWSSAEEWAGELHRLLATGIDAPAGEKVPFSHSALTLQARPPSEAPAPEALAVPEPVVAPPAPSKPPAPPAEPVALKHGPQSGSGSHDRKKLPERVAERAPVVARSNWVDALRPHAAWIVTVGVTCVLVLMFVIGAR
jgi:serine/threonine protein kinase